MVDRRSAARTLDQVTGKPEILAAREELTTLDKLSQALVSIISDLLRLRPQFDRKSSTADFALHEVRYSSLKGYQELADHCYGRTVLGKEVDDDGLVKGQFTYRITQANVGYVDNGCYVLARNSPIASKLVTANPGDESEVAVPKGTRILTTDEVRTFEGPVSLRSPSRQPNFRSMAVQSTGGTKPLIIQDLRAFINALTAESSNYADILDTEAVPTTPHVGPTEAVGDAVDHDPTWLQSWRDVYLSDSETSSLSHQFFTRTTRAQEVGLSNPFGLTFVEGIAGAGKTSVALGRLKFFANFATGEQREHYGLQNAPANDFSPIGMVGFVLSHSLKRYLKETAAALELTGFPIRDFQEFRIDLSNQFGLTQRFKLNKADAPSCRTKLAWLLAIDTAMARAAGIRLQEIASSEQDAPVAVKDTVLRIGAELARSQLDADLAKFHLSGLARRVAADVMNAEFRTREVSIRERMSREPSRNIRVDLEAAMNRLQQERERQALSLLTRRLLGALAAHDLIAPAIQLQEFPTLVHQAFGNPIEAGAARELDNAIDSIRTLIASPNGEGHRRLTNADLVILITSAAMIADEFEYLDAPAHLYQVRQNTAVFIDEVQDFTEVEVLLMGMTATSKYHQVTLSGDRRQRLQSMGAEQYQALFPSIPKLRQNAPIFLDRNFRQRKELAALSAGVRFVLQGDTRVAFDSDDAIPAASVYRFSSQATMARLVLERIRTVNPYATVAVIAPSSEDARHWYDLLHEDLAAYHRPALLSHRDDLTRRHDIHFTDVRETKGLEFDVVVIPDLSSFHLETVIGRNQLYVAISRPKHALLMGCSEGGFSREELKKLIASGLISPAQIPSSLTH